MTEHQLLKTDSKHEDKDEDKREDESSTTNIISRATLVSSLKSSIKKESITNVIRKQIEYLSDYINTSKIKKERTYLLKLGKTLETLNSLNIRLDIDTFDYILFLLKWKYLISLNWCEHLKIKLTEQYVQWIKYRQYEFIYDLIYKETLNFSLLFTKLNIKHVGNILRYDEKLRDELIVFLVYSIQQLLVEGKKSLEKFQTEFNTKNNFNRTTLIMDQHINEKFELLTNRINSQINKFKVNIKDEVQILTNKTEQKIEFLMNKIESVNTVATANNLSIYKQVNLLNANFKALENDRLWTKRFTILLLILSFLLIMTNIYSLYN